MVCSDFYDFKGKTVLITGASSGLGERFATILSSAGAKVISVSYTHLTLPTTPYV